MNPEGPTRASEQTDEQAATGGGAPHVFDGVNVNAELVADLLAATGLLPDDKLNALRGVAGQGSLAEALVSGGFAASEGVARMLAARHHVPLTDVALTGVDKKPPDLVPLHVLERLVAIPYALDGDSLRVAIADPADLHAIDELRLATRHRLALSVAARDDILTELRRLSRASEAFGARAALAEEAALLEEEEEDVDDLDVEDGISEAPLVRLVNSIIFQAAEDGASDVHFEPQEDALAVRLRIDGVLHEVQRIPKRMMAGVTTRLKVLAKLDIAERRKPQDGRISLNAAAAGRMLDIRVATLPTVEGESVVMRLLDKSKRPPTLEELGLSDAMRQTLEEVVSRPTGALLVTGPTGSGKSTTLYAALAEINNSEINIITVEDPVEYRLGGGNPTPSNPRAPPALPAPAPPPPPPGPRPGGGARGCPRCNQTGYKGRVGVFQLLTMSENLETLAATKASREELERAAMEEGMRTLWDDGIAKVAAGLTSIEELARVTI